ncbi:3206_t:CDS:2 [Rhizophagus irregularis]|nr:3206_t:CDS:2 [Rhizophagus irregularis]
MFEGMKWQDIIQLNDEQLLEKGIKTFTVRSELLYYFNIIKAAKAEKDAKKESSGISVTKDDKDKD